MVAIRVGKKNNHHESCFQTHFILFIKFFIKLYQKSLKMTNFVFTGKKCFNNKLCQPCLLLTSPCSHSTWVPRPISQFLLNSAATTRNYKKKNICLLQPSKQASTGNKLTFLWIVLIQVWSLRLIFYELFLSLPYNKRKSFFFLL